MHGVCLHGGGDAGGGPRGVYINVGQKDWGEGGVLMVEGGVLTESLCFIESL